MSALSSSEHDGKKEVLLQTRWKPASDPLYSGTLEFAAGQLDKPYENIFDATAREIQEETGLTLKSVVGEDRTKIYSPKGSDASFAFRPFCCTQQLKDGRPWIGFIFIVEVEDGEPKAQLSETKDVHWMLASEVQDIFEHHPETLFGLELPAWEYYFRDRVA